MPTDSSCPTFRGRVVAAVLLNLLLVYFSPAGAFAASQSGTTMPTAALIEDSVGNIWTPANNIFYVNGIAVTGAVTILLLYYNNTIYANNSDGNWYSWNNGWQSTTGDPRGGGGGGGGGGSTSPSGATIPTASQIVDGAGNVWTRSGGSFQVNGNSVTSSITILLLYFNNTIYANNSDGNWYKWSNGSFYVSGDPRGTNTTTDNTNHNTIDLRGYTLTFNDEFTGPTISDSLVYNGANWYTHNEQCCMAATDGSTTAMVGLSDQPSPFSLIPGGGLRIRLQKINNHWTSGVLTSVDNSGIGFSQQYGYFEIEAAFPSGFDTWPAFWMLNTAAKARGAPAGEIDIVEYIANPGFIDYIRTTLHDWGNN